MPKVFVIQNQHRWSEADRTFIPKYDISSAGEYGELCPILSPTASPFKPANVLPDINRALEGFTDEDHLLLIGNPILIGMCVSRAAFFNSGRVKLLQWSGKEGKYICVVVEGLQ